MKSLISTLALALGAGTLAVLAAPTAASAHWVDPPQVQLGWTDSATPATGHQPGNGTDLPLGTWVDEAGVSHTSRLYVTYDLSQFEGKKAYGAKLFVQESSATDCTRRDIEVWRTRAVSATPKWRNPPAPLTKLDEIQTPEYCPRATVDFDVSAAFIDAVQRKQRLVTFELRVSAAHEADPAYGRRLSGWYGVRFSVDYNTVPQVLNDRLYTTGFSCTQLKPYPKQNFVVLAAGALDLDGGVTSSQLSMEFAVWPVGQPDARKIYPVSAYGPLPGRVLGLSVPHADLINGQSYGWQARLTDGRDTSKWSRKCFFAHDRTAPSAPTVTSANFPDQSSTGPAGEHPVFTFDGHGDRDIAGFQYSWSELVSPTSCEYSGEHGQLVCDDPFELPNRVRAAEPGGRATVTLNPDRFGMATLSVRALDLAGNPSPTVTYQVLLPSSSPRVERQGPPPRWNQEVTLKLSPHPNIQGVTEYEIRGLDGQTETRSADADGVAYYTFVATNPSFGQIEVRSRSANGFVSPAESWFYHLDPGPGVSSEVYPSGSGPSGGIGVPGDFTFAPPPGWTEVAGYRYTFDDENFADVTAGADGTATITWTPTVSRSYILSVWAIKADGTWSEYSSYYSFQVA
jgi:hypothetical protein